MVAVGDSNEVFMFNITNSGEYVHTASLCGKSKTNMFGCINCSSDNGILLMDINSFEGLQLFVFMESEFR